MKLPFVSRGTLDLLLAEKDARIAELRDALATDRAERQRLFDTLHPLPSNVVALPAPIKREPTKIDHAINAAAGENRHLRRYLQQWAAAEKLKGEMDEDTIALKIIRGDRVDDDAPVDDEALA